MSAIAALSTACPVPGGRGRFTELTRFQERLYFAALLCAAAASALFIAPTAHHRIEFRLKDKEHIVLLANN
jgi:uncharacterized protein DUF6328